MLGGVRLLGTGWAACWVRGIQFVFEGGKRGVGACTELCQRDAFLTGEG